MSVQRRCEQIAMNCGSYRAHERIPTDPPDPALTALTTMRIGIAVYLISTRKSIAA